MAPSAASARVRGGRRVNKHAGTGGNTCDGEGEAVQRDVCVPPQGRARDSWAERWPRYRSVLRRKVNVSLQLLP